MDAKVHQRLALRKGPLMTPNLPYRAHRFGLRLILTFIGMGFLGTGCTPGTTNVRPEAPPPDAETLQKNRDALMVTACLIKVRDLPRLGTLISSSGHHWAGGQVYQLPVSRLGFQPQDVGGEHAMIEVVPDDMRVLMKLDPMRSYTPPITVTQTLASTSAARFNEVFAGGLAELVGSGMKEQTDKLRPVLCPEPKHGSPLTTEARREVAVQKASREGRSTAPKADKK